MAGGFRYRHGLEAEVDEEALRQPELRGIARALEEFHPRKRRHQPPVGRVDQPSGSQVAALGPDEDVGVKEHDAGERGAFP